MKAYWINFHSDSPLISFGIWKSRSHLHTENMLQQSTVCTILGVTNLLIGYYVFRNRLFLWLETQITSHCSARFRHFSHRPPTFTTIISGHFATFLHRQFISSDFWSWNVLRLQISLNDRLPLFISAPSWTAATPFTPSAWSSWWLRGAIQLKFRIYGIVWGHV